MSEKRFIVYDDEFSKHIEDTNYTEDKHEHNLYNIWEMCHKLNEVSNENEKLKEEINLLKIKLKRFERIMEDFDISSFDELQTIKEVNND